ncbi:MAG: PEP-utilizing enzyme [Pseudomonadota bacterium]
MALDGTSFAPRRAAPLGRVPGDEGSLFGRKTAFLMALARQGYPVPAGVAWTVAEVRDWRTGRATIDPAPALAFLRREDDPGDAPLLVSVRGGAASSMPGMLATVLNVGLTRARLPALATWASPLDDEAGRRFAWDCYRRLLASLLDDSFEAAANLADLIAQTEDLERETRARLGTRAEAVLTDPEAQLTYAMTLVAQSWDAPRVQAFRRAQDPNAPAGTALTIQRMVFGNLPGDSLAGVAYSRDPLTGEQGLYGEYLPHVQGSDLAQGIVNPRPLRSGQGGQAADDLALSSTHPVLFERLGEMVAHLEATWADLMEIEFTLQRGVLFILQVRPAKRAAQAARQVAVDLHRQGIIDRARALVLAGPLEGARRIAVIPDDQVLGQGLAACAGVARGPIVIDVARTAPDSILVRQETSPKDMKGIATASGLITARGGAASHAAAAARALGKPCVCNVDNLVIDEAAGRVSFGETILRLGDIITVDGHRGIVAQGHLDIIEEGDKAMEILRSWQGTS